MARVRYAVGLPNVGEFGDTRVLVELAVLAEEHGWDGVYLWDHVLYHDPSWPVANPTVTAAAIAALTNRIRLIVMHVLPRRRVQIVARESVSLDVLSGGRLTFAAVIGSMDLEYAGFGEATDLRARGALLDAALADLCGLWSAEPVTVADGAEPVRMVPGPLQQPRIPIWCGGRWPNRAPLRRAARYDGAMPTFVQNTPVPASELAAAVAFIASCREDAGAATAGADRAGAPDEGAQRPDFDIAMEGATEPATAAATVASYAEVGLTWWVEAMGWWRAEPGTAVAAARSRIFAGPPTD
jgi:alkanesulfonate monooxygenase SsuD/methylene tetrahydromethanopterin reductase-like flavin-dependent oxidoreductase (luciferase family)